MNEFRRQLNARLPDGAKYPPHMGRLNEDGMNGYYLRYYTVGQRDAAFEAMQTSEHFVLLPQVWDADYLLIADKGEA